eukprot:CAMPEP_0201545348 /NCGR_PEP_ID=MMETSP0173_2-20130828/1877_1 /ASSEMBLY_ACC=CAM_ASM_000268 /TAXON_ID=218659 /ORGANISM="Vexillifera sp., Strain DIVA3 564/2" /LENGTH=346 /DNA_ID=CAMNT_0047953727 /DNA_START=24 /DNA_END=1064 /DNA_ORIENTATION=+
MSSTGSSSSNSKEPLGLAVCGGGRIGKVHTDNLGGKKQTYNVLYCVDIVASAAAEMAAKFDNAQGTDDYAKVLADDKVDAVLVCTPTATHVDYIKKALNANKHVFCEKPISMDVDEIRECFALAEKQGKQLYCGYQRRADPNFRALKLAIEQGKIGTVHVIKSTSRDHPTPSIAFLKISGGFFHDCASHDIDLCRWVTGEDPTEVFATAHAFNPEIGAIDDVDTAVITLKFPSGVLAVIDISRKAVYGYDQRLEVHGDAGMVQTENVAKSSCIISTVDGISSDNPHYSFPQRYREAYSNELDHFFDIIRNGATPFCNAESCISVALIANAAEEAAKTGKPIQFGSK